MKTNLLLTLFCCVIFAWTANAQSPVPYADFPFDEDFDDAMGNVLLDAGGDITIDEDSERGGCVYFPGGTNADPHYITLYPEAWGLPEITYSMWFKLESVATWSRLFTGGTEGQGSSAHEIWTSPANGRFGGNLTCSADYDFRQGPEVDCGIKPELDTWYHFSFGLDEDILRVYLDGELISEVDHPVGPLDEAELPNIYLGKSVWNDPLLNGWIDDFRIYDKLIDDDEAMAIYNGEAYVGVKDLNDSGIKVYPSNGKIYVKNINNSNIQSVKIFNTVGQLKYQTNQVKGMIDANLEPNVYLVSVKTEKGTFQNKLIIQ